MALFAARFEEEPPLPSPLLLFPPLRLLRDEDEEADEEEKKSDDEDEDEDEKKSTLRAKERLPLMTLLSTLVMLALCTAAGVADVATADVIDFGPFASSSKKLSSLLISPLCPFVPPLLLLL